MSTERRFDRLDGFLTGPLWAGQAHLRRIVETALDRQAEEGLLPALQRAMLAAADGVSPLPALPSPIPSVWRPTHLQFLAAHSASLGQRAEAAGFYANAAMAFIEQGHSEHAERLCELIDEDVIDSSAYGEFVLNIHREKEKALQGAHVLQRL